MASKILQILRVTGKTLQSTRPISSAPSTCGDSFADQKSGFIHERVLESTCVGVERGRFQV
jgi:hypothetical protein